MGVVHSTSPWAQAIRRGRQNGTWSPEITMLSAWFAELKSSRKGHSGLRTWMVRSPSELTSQKTWTLLGTGSKKLVYRAKLAASARPVIVKKGRDPKDMLQRELFYLQYLRGLSGVPYLLGGWSDSKGTVHYVLNSTHGEPAGYHSPGAENTVQSMSPTYKRLARDRPVELALAVLQCFRSFSELGGFFLRDFTPKQFIVHDHGKDKRIGFLLVDEPIAAVGPVADLKLRNDATGGNARFWAQVKTLGYSNSFERGNECKEDMHCQQATLAWHCCCKLHVNSPTDRRWTSDTKASFNNGSNKICAKSVPPGAPELSHPCRRSRSDTLQRCAPLTEKTHAYDVVTKPWLLPLMAHHPAVAALLPLMARMEQSERMSFGQAIEFLKNISIG